MIIPHYIDFEKARVKSHTRKTKKGKLSQVKEYQNKKTKKENVKGSKYVGKSFYSSGFGNVKPGYHTVQRAKRMLGFEQGYNYFYFNEYNPNKLHRVDILADSWKEADKKFYEQMIQANGMKYVGIIKSFENDFEKAVIRAHTRKTKTGKLSQVKQYTDKRIKKVKPKNPWIAKYGHLKLNGYPPADVKNVDVNLKGDIHSHHILTWIDKKTGLRKHVYTDEFMKRNKEKKWQRVASVDINMINDIKEKTKLHVLGQGDKKLYSGKMQQLGAVVNIIAHTGLRVGSYQVYRQTGNRGVTTLAPENVNVKGDTIYFDFIGKSYQQNKAQIKDKELADYITKLKKQRKGKELLFDTEYKLVQKYFNNTLGLKGKAKIKDMRTYVATDLARELLFKEKINIKSLSKNKQKKILNDTIKKISEQVADKLNNTATVAKASYIHPNVQLAWLNAMEIEPELQEEIVKAENKKMPSLDDIVKMYPPKKETINIDEMDEELCDEYEIVSFLQEDENKISKGINEMEIQKARVKSHQRRTKSGKISQVKEYQDNRQKKDSEGKKLSTKMKIKRSDVDGKYHIIQNGKSIAGFEKEGTARSVAIMHEGLIWDDKKGNWYDPKKIKKSQDDDLVYYIDIEKANVKSFQKRTKSGKLVTVRDHQRNIAKKTLNMPDAMAGVMGGPTKEEAKKFLDEDKKSNKTFSKSKVENMLNENDVYVDQIRKVGDNEFIVRKGFFYTHGKTAEDFRLQIDASLTKSLGGNAKFTIVDFGEKWKPFKGGATITNSSHWFVQFKINDLKKSSDDDLGLYIDIEKARVKAHARKTKTGKISQVREYTDKRTKKQQEQKQQKQVGAEQQQINEGDIHPAVKLQKKVKHIDFILKNYPELIDKDKAMKMKKNLKEKIRKVEDLVEDDYDEEVNPHPPNWQGEDEDEYRGEEGSDAGVDKLERDQKRNAKIASETKKEASKDFEKYNKIKSDLKEMLKKEHEEGMTPTQFKGGDLPVYKTNYKGKEVMTVKGNDGNGDAFYIYDDKQKRVVALQPVEDYEDDMKLTTYKIKQSSLRQWSDSFTDKKQKKTTDEKKENNDKETVKKYLQKYLDSGRSNIQFVLSPGRNTVYKNDKDDFILKTDGGYLILNKDGAKAVSSSMMQSKLKDSGIEIGKDDFKQMKNAKKQDIKKKMM